MSQKALELLQAERAKLILAQRDCAYCGAHFDSSDELGAHLIDAHVEPPKPFAELYGEELMECGCPDCRGVLGEDHEIK